MASLNEILNHTTIQKEVIIELLEKSASTGKMDFREKIHVGFLNKPIVDYSKGDFGETVPNITDVRLLKRKEFKMYSGFKAVPGNYAGAKWKLCDMETGELWSPPNSVHGSSITLGPHECKMLLKNKGGH